MASSSAADVSITREQLTKYFHLPITDVAKELGICATMLKKICRKNGIPRWPHRKIKSLNKMIESLEASLTNDGSEAGECIRQEIIILKNKKSLIMRNPSILVQGNPNKRSSEGADDLPSGKKQRTDPLQAPITTFNNPKSSVPTAPNSFSINQLLTPPTTFSSPVNSGTGMDEKDYRAYAHHPHGYPPHHMMMPYSSESSKPAHMEGRSYASPLTSYLPGEEDGRHLDGAPLLHPSSTDPYYYHKAALAYQYYPRQMLPPTAYPPHLAASSSPHHARSPYYLPFGPSSHDGRTMQHMITEGGHPAEGVPPTSDTLQQQEQQQSQHTQQPSTSSPSSQQVQQTQQAQQLQQQLTTAKGQQQLVQRLQQQQQQQQQTAQQQQESLPKMNIPSSSPDMYKYKNPPSPQSSSSSFSQGSELPYFYHQYPNSQSQRLHQQ